MHFARQTSCFLVTVALVLTASSGTLRAQARSRIEMNRPGNLSRPGGNTSVNAFQRYSYGLGGLRGASGGASSNVLSSQMSRSGFDIQRSTQNRSRGGLGLSTNVQPEGSSASSVQRYSVPGAVIRDFGGPGSDGAITGRGRGQEALGAAFAYLDTFGTSEDDELIKTGSEPITSLAPEGDSIYARYMQQAEQAVQDGDYHEAIAQYKLAQLIGRTDPESFLGLAHAHMAMSGGISYSSAAYYLSQALKYFPELPLVQLRPRSFFGDADRYAEIIAQLRRRLDRNPRDTDALVCLAYLRWFEGESAIAKRSLETAVRYSADEDLKEAAEGFLEGIDRLERGQTGETATASEDSPQ